MSLELNEHFYSEFKDYIKSLRAHSAFSPSSFNRQHLRRTYELLRQIRTRSLRAKAEVTASAFIIGEDASSMPEESDLELSAADDDQPVLEPEFMKLLEKYDRSMVKYFPVLDLGSRRSFAYALCCAMRVPSERVDRWIP